MIRVDVVKRIGNLEIQARFRLAGPGILALSGPSGAGKTSIVNMIAGLLDPDQGAITAGEVVLFDSEQRVNLPPSRRRIGYIFQDGRLFPHLNVLRNLNYGRRGDSAGEEAASLDEIVEVLDIGHLLKRRPHHLSGGEKQRVAIGRALLTHPRLLLMDEPLSSVDDSRKLEILALISSLPGRFHIPILYVSHAMDELAALSAEIVRLDTRPAPAGSLAQRVTLARSGRD